MCSTFLDGRVLPYLMLIEDPTFGRNFEVNKPEAQDAEQVRRSLTTKLSVVYCVVAAPSIVGFAMQGRMPQAGLAAFAVFLYSLIPVMLKRGASLRTPAWLFVGVGYVLTTVNFYCDFGEPSFLMGVWGANLLLYTNIVLGRFSGILITVMYLLPIIVFGQMHRIGAEFPLLSGYDPLPPPPLLVQVAPILFFLYIILEYLRLEARSRQRLTETVAEKTVLNCELREAVKELSRKEKDLKEARKRAEEQAELRKRFLSNISHEIRTPLNGIIGMSRFLKESVQQPGQLEDLATLQYSAENLLFLTNNILDFRKMEEGELRQERHPFDLGATLKHSVRLWEWTGQQKRVAVHAEVDPKLPRRMLGDGNRVTQIVNNMVSNALRFTEEGEVKVCARLVALDDERASVEIDVSDTGIGIAPENQKKIFDSFFQVETEGTLGTGGTGLGLAIVRDLLHAMDGQIRLSSEVGKGSVFTISVSFPLAEEKDQELGDTGLGAEKESELRILLIEDNSVNRMVARRLLERRGAIVVEAADGVEATEILEKDQAFHLVLVDLRMPRMDGFEVLRWIRSHTESSVAGLHVVALTANVMEETRRALKEAGANAFLSKPLKEEIFWKTVLAHSGEVA